MRYHILATDYDGTLATDGQLLGETREALERLRTSGRKIVMVTGRQLDDLRRVCSDLSPFEIVVAENGAVLYWPATNEKRVLAEAPPREFVERLRQLGVWQSVASRGHLPGGRSSPIAGRGLLWPPCSHILPVLLPRPGKLGRRKTMLPIAMSSFTSVPPSRTH